MEPGDPVVPEEEAPAPSSHPTAKIALFFVVALALVTAGFLLFRSGGSGPAGSAAPPAPSPGGPPPGAIVVVAPVKLSPEAALVADRFNCLCGDCQDTLGKCTCTRDKGSDEMKTALNRIVTEKKTLAEIEAAMVARFGPGVVATAVSPAGTPGKK